MTSADRVREPSAAVFGKVLACVSAESITTDILEPVAEMLSAESGVYLQFISTPHDPYRVGEGQLLGSRPQALEAYVDGLYELDPVIRPVLHSLEAQTLQASQATQTSFEQGELDGDLYTETFLKRYDIGHVMAVAMPVRIGAETQLACLGFHRRYGDAPFLPQDLARFQQLSPAFQAVFRSLASREALDLSRAVIEASGCRSGDYSYLVFGDDLTIRNATEGPTGGDRAGLHELMDPFVLGDIKQALLVAPPELGAARPFTATTGDGSTVEGELRAIQASETKTYYLAVSHGEPLQRSLGSAAAALGFTARETEIAGLIAAGKRNASLAADLGISFRTVENHLRSIYRKSSVGSRTELVSRLFSL